MEASFAAFTAFLLAAGPVSVGVTKVVDFLRNLIDPAGTRVPKVGWNVAAVVVGVAFCLGWGFNPFEALVQSIPALQESSSFEGAGGEIFSGLVVGGMAGFWHEKLDQWSSSAKASRAAAGQLPKTS